ncbi:hypothetical protein [Chondrinema litorale]|uniref:nSTAND1 domain-containing NTPase n=1 Tax=Chondrinema litorale TaxID=2994555 RepID=UPI002543B006|nr:hypothetical protein [Chondrinema litorale]UZR95875.1 hypothetical protein OQ292_08620 [Chondrinema litorale]
MIAEEVQTITNPFPGLRPFRTDEAHLFFGREGQVDEVLDKLEENKFVAVLGASGSGKSSLMYCGLIPGLYGGFMTQAGSNWRVVVTRPGIAPIHNLNKAILKSSEYWNENSSDDKDIKTASGMATLRSSSLGLVDFVKQQQNEPDEHFLILVDQFEELFRFSKIARDEDSINESYAFVKLILEAVKQSEVPIYIVMTMRSDYIGDCAHYPHLTQLINDSHYLIPKMTRLQKKAAIMGPAAVAGTVMSSRLLQQLLNDLGDKQDDLPILQHALMRTWELWRKNKDSEEIDIFHYESIGTLKEALSLHADEAYEDLDDRQKYICEVLFKSLTEKGQDGRGVRRPTKVKEISGIADCDTDEVIHVVEVFRKVGRTLLMPPPSVPLTAESVVDISHESLMRVWNRCREWVDEEAESAKVYKRLSEAAEMYQVGQASLWRPPDLQLALNWQMKQKPNLTWAERHHPAFERTMVFLEMSRKAYETEQKSKEKHQKAIIRRNKIAALIGAFVAIAGLILVLYANLKKQEAESEKERALLSEGKAESAAEEARKNAERAELQKHLAMEKEAEALKNEQEAKFAQEMAQLSAEEAEKQKIIAIAKAEEARKQSQIAREQTQIARRKTRLAELSELKAETAAEKAERLRYISIAQKMAIKSIQIKDTTQRALVAKQAFIFNQRYDGNLYNPDIYDGLYYAQKLMNGESFNVISDHDDAVRSLTTDRTSKWLFSSGSDGKIFMRSFDSLSGTPINQIVEENTIFRKIAVSPNNEIMACGTDESKIILYDRNTLNVLNELHGHDGTVWEILFDKSGKYMFTTGSDMKIIKWDTDTWTYEVITELNTIIRALALSRNDKSLVAALKNGTILEWNLEDFTDLRVLHSELSDAATSLKFSPDGSLLVKGFESGRIFLWDIEQDNMINYLEGHDARITELSFSKNGKFMASSSWDGTIRLWKMDQINEQPIVMRDQNSWVQAICFSPDDRYLIAACMDHSIKIYPIDIEEMASGICDNIKRNMSDDEWKKHVANEIDYELTCQDLPKGRDD